ncbi:MAG TPA: SAM-dependent methyltransferase [Chloroflexota bacterium]
MAPQPSPLELELRARISQHGPISFREVMQAALYHPRFGYYTNLRGFGAEGDFITSPERHPAFGWLLGRQALDVWEALDRPRPFTILELGGGSGALAEGLMAFLRGDAASDLKARDVVYTLDEISPSLRAIQQRRLTRPQFRWQGADEPAHFIVANEVADALPTHRAIRRSGRMRELFVGLDARDELTWVETDGAASELEAYFQALHYEPPEGSIVDVCLDLADWVRSIARRLERGMALLVDYTASPPRDSLLTYYRHTLGSDPLVRLGQQDLSAHVDLRSLVRMAIGEGLRAGATAQRGLLFNLGFAQVQARLTGMTDRRALGHLVDPDGAGGKIAGVFLMRGLPPEYRPAGAVGRDWPEPGEIPSLPPDPDERDFLDQWSEAFGPTA